MDLAAPTTTLLCRQDVSTPTLLKMTAEWTCTSEGSFITNGVHALSKPVTCIVNMINRAEACWPQAVCIYDHGISKQGQDTDVEAYLARHTSIGKELQIPPHPIAPHKERVASLEMFAATAIKGLFDSHNLVFLIDAPSADECADLEHSMQRLHDLACALPSNAHVVLHIDVRSNYIIHDEDSVFVEKPAGDIVTSHLKSIGPIPPNLNVLVCGTSRVRASLSSLFGTCKSTNMDTAYRTVTFPLPEHVQLDDARLSRALIVSDNVAKHTLTRGTRSLSFQATAVAPVTVVFFALVDTATTPSLVGPNVVAWLDAAVSASSSVIEEAITGGARLARIDALTKAMLESTPYLKAMHELCVANAQQEWSGLWLDSMHQAIDILAQPPQKRPRLVPVHSHA